MRTKHGFTLVELMIVIAIIAIASSMAIPNYLSWRSKQMVLRAADEINTSVQLAKMTAIKERRKVVMAFSPADGSWSAFVDDDEDGSRDGNERLVRAGSVANAEIGLSTDFPLQKLVFDTRGLATNAGKVTLTHPRLPSKEVAVTITGSSRVQ